MFCSDIVLPTLRRSALAVSRVLAVLTNKQFNRLTLQTYHILFGRYIPAGLLGMSACMFGNLSQAVKNEHAVKRQPIRLEQNCQHLCGISRPSTGDMTLQAYDLPCINPKVFPCRLSHMSAHNIRTICTTIPAEAYLALPSSTLHFERRRKMLGRKLKGKHNSQIGKYDVRSARVCYPADKTSCPLDGRTQVRSIGTTGLQGAIRDPWAPPNQVGSPTRVPNRVLAHSLRIV